MYRDLTQRWCFQLGSKMTCALKRSYPYSSSMLTVPWGKRETDGNVLSCSPEQSYKVLKPLWHRRKKCVMLQMPPQHNRITHGTGLHSGSQVMTKASSKSCPISALPQTLCWDYIKENKVKTSCWTHCYVKTWEILEVYLYWGETKPKIQACNTNTKTGYCKELRKAKIQLLWQ